MAREVLESVPAAKIIGRSPQIGVIGGSNSNLPVDIAERTRLLRDAELVGRDLALHGAILISGGTDGVMEASCKGAFEAGGITVGTPGRNRSSSNRFIKVEVCTPIDTGDFLFAGVLSCDAIIVFPGGAGTIAEVALAYRNHIPMIIMQGYEGQYDNMVGQTYDRSEGKLKFLGTADPKEAISLALNIASKFTTTHNDIQDTHGIIDL